MLVFRFSHFFRDPDGHIYDIPKKERCLIAYEILSRTTFSKRNAQSTTIFTDTCDDMKMGIELMVANGSFLAAYPLHEVNQHFFKALDMGPKALHKHYRIFIDK